MPYGVATFGDVTKSVSVGVGGLLGNIDGEVEVADGVVLGLGGEYQINNGVKLIGEALTLVSGEGDTGVLLLPGVRLFGERFAFDIFGFLAVGEGEAVGFAPLPSRVSYTF